MSVALAMQEQFAHKQAVGFAAHPERQPCGSRSMSGLACSAFGGRLSEGTRWHRRSARSFLQKPQTHASPAQQLDGCRLRAAAVGLVHACPVA